MRTPLAAAALVALVLAPLALVMGLPFPLAIETLKQDRAESIPWAWGLNGCGALIGPVVGMGLAVYWGITAVWVAAAIASGELKKAVVKLVNVAKYIGPVRFMAEAKARRIIPGIAMGLAWTPVGGDLLFIEATAMPGKKGLTLTGQLGDVMKESASAAMSWIRSHTKLLDIDDDFFDNHDIHIHVPAGAIPKDGPSAGVTMLTALVSLISEKRIHKDLAMTGEITLRGQVLPVGGIKEKVLAAHRAGIKTIILPKWNEKDLVDIPKKVQREVEFLFVDQMQDVLKLALKE